MLMIERLKDLDLLAKYAKLRKEIGEAEAQLQVTLEALRKLRDEAQDVLEVLTESAEKDGE